MRPLVFTAATVAQFDFECKKLSAFSAYVGDGVKRKIIFSSFRDVKKTLHYDAINVQHFAWSLFAAPKHSGQSAATVMKNPNAPHPNV
jgi:hypothetical protein